MPLKEIMFNDEKVITFVVKIENKNWMMVDPLGKALGFDDVSAVMVSEKNAAVKTFDEIRAYIDNDIEEIRTYFNIRLDTKFTTDVGLYQLILKSKTWFGKQFRHWLGHRAYESFCDYEPLAVYCKWRSDAHNREKLNIEVPDNDDENDNNNNAGCVYVITNSLLESIDAYKIGATYDLNARLTILNADSPFEYRVVFARKVLDAKWAEHQLHKEFDKARIKGNFYKLTVEDLMFIQKLCFL